MEKKKKKEEEEEEEKKNGTYEVKTNHNVNKKYSVLRKESWG